eukprot:2316762-Amphidinium_carterae.1
MLPRSIVFLQPPQASGSTSSSCKSSLAFRPLYSVWSWYRSWLPRSAAGREEAARKAGFKGLLPSRSSTVHHFLMVWEVPPPPLPFPFPLVFVATCASLYCTISKVVEGAIGTGPGCTSFALNGTPLNVAREIPCRTSKLC